MAAGSAGPQDASFCEESTIRQTCYDWLDGARRTQDPRDRPAAVWRMVEIKKDQDIYREGIFARALGRSLDSNPYSAEAKESAIWDMGWRMIDEDREGLSTRAIKSVPDFRSGVVTPMAHRRRCRVFAEVLAARQQVLQIVIVVAATALMIGLLIITSR